MKQFIVSAYQPTTRRDQDYPVTHEDFSRRTDAIRRGDFSYLRREIGSLNILGAPTPTS